MFFSAVFHCFKNQILLFFCFLGDPSKQDGFYRLDYRPPVGFPVANSTFKPSDISDTIDFSRDILHLLKHWGFLGAKRDLTLLDYVIKLCIFL